MVTISSVSLVLFHVFGILLVQSAGKKPIALNQQLLVISFDGFRQLYLNSTLLPWFNYFGDVGVISDKTQSIFPSDTFPNHWAIVTGRYAESHGIVSNSFYDPNLNKTFDMGSTQVYWWDKAEPIWQTARKQGRKRTGVSFWPGSSVQFDNGTGTPDFYRRVYDPKVAFETLIDESVHYLSKEKVDLALLYFDQPDAVGHASGPDSAPVKLQLQKMDWYLSYILLSLERANLGPDKLNIIVCADHGMVLDINKLWLGNYVDMNSIEAVPSQGAVVSIKAKPDKKEELLANLTKGGEASGGLFKAYLRENVPTEFHYSHNERILDIVIICKLGTYMSRAKNSNPIGSHGFDPKEIPMRPVFMARGPAFKSGGYQAANMFETKDIYAMMAYVVGITPAETNATLENVRDIFLVDPFAENSSTSTSTSTSAPTTTSTSSLATPSYWTVIFISLVSMYHSI